MIHPSAVRTPATPAPEITASSTATQGLIGSAADARSGPAKVRALHSPAVLTVLLVLVLSVGVGVAAAAGTTGSAGTPAEGAGGPTGSAATAANPAADATSTDDPTSQPSSGNASPDSAGATSPAPGDIAREAGQGAAVGDAPLLNHGRLDPRMATRSTTTPSITATAGPQGFAPLHIGDLAAVVILVVAVALLVGVGRMMFRLFAVLGAVVEVTAKIGSSLTVLMAILGLVIVAVVVAH